MKRIRIIRNPSTTDGRPSGELTAAAASNTSVTSEASFSTPYEPILRTKIYGERNTGTRFLTDLIRKNFTLPTLRGTTTGEHDSLNLGAFKSVFRRLARDRQTYWANLKDMPETLGWKHMNPPIEFLRVQSDIASTTLFLVIVKHPVFWTLSFQRHPYDSYFSVGKMPFQEFIRHIFIPTGRDNVAVPYYDSIIDLYAAKVDGYRELASLGVPFELIRYEELVESVPNFLKAIEQKYSLPRRSDEDAIRETSTKKDERVVDERVLDDFRSHYRLDLVSQAVSPEDREFIISKFGEQRLRWLGYPS